MNGALVISLDFEIMWGVFDKPTSRTAYLKNLYGVKKAIPAMLDLFKKYDVHATFATVGLLFADSRQDIINYSPIHKPEYLNKSLSPYFTEMEKIGESEYDDPLHYAPSLINEITASGLHEIASHTFCHYYCLEKGQTTLAFEADLTGAVNIAKKRNIVLNSIVFPRNQFNEEYLTVIKKLGFTSYRGNENVWMYNARNRDEETLGRRAARLIDSYMNISGHNIYKWEEISDTKGLCNIPASRFLRPYSRKLAILEHLRLRRIKSGMLAAAKRGHIYHLWWHPHNFGVNTEKNIKFLEEILKYYQKLRNEYKFSSFTMNEVSDVVSKMK